MKKYILSTIAFLTIVTSHAQEFSKFTIEDFKKDKNYGWFNYIQVSGYKGQHLAEGELADFFSEGFYAIGIRFGTQSTGRKNWQRLHNYPQYGVGLSYFDLGGTDIDSLIGMPTAVYFFYGAPISSFRNYRLNADVEIGLSTDFKAYDSEVNPDQIFIGSTTNLHFNLALQLYHKLSERMDLSLGLSLMHFSNGKMFTPQKGINLIGLNLSTTYNFNPVKNYTKHVVPNYHPPVRPTLVQEEVPPFKGIHKLSFMGSIGTVQTDPGEWRHENGILDTTNIIGPRYLTNSFSMDYCYQFAHRLKYVVGLDMFFDNSAKNLYDSTLPKDVTFSKKAFYGGHIGFQYVIERVTVIYNYGRYLYKPFEQRGKWYMRAGGRVGLTPEIDMQIALKTRNGGIADWIEWGVVYTIRSK